MFSEIAEIKSIREQMARLSEREAELTAPALTDLDRIRTLYEWFKELQSERNCAPREGGVHQRKMFIFIVIFLYSPSTLAGGRMLKGLREELAIVLDMHNRETISNNCSSVVFMYNQYKYFRRDIEGLYIEIMKRVRPGD